MKFRGKNKTWNSISEGTGLIDYVLFQPMEYFILKVLKLNINPNFITTFTLFYTLLSSMLIATGNAIVGACMYMIFPVLDGLDGAIARLYNKKSTFGAYYDGFVDVFGEILIIVALNFFFHQVLFVYLAVFIMIIQYAGIRYKWVYQDKERQENIFHQKNPVLFLILALTRNDMRKLVVLLSVILVSWKLVIIYFTILYVLAGLNILKKTIFK